MYGIIITLRACARGKAIGSVAVHTKSLDLDVLASTQQYHDVKKGEKVTKLGLKVCYDW